MTSSTLIWGGSAAKIRRDKEFVTRFSLRSPADFDVPQELETEHFRLRMLSGEDIEQDYEAVIESHGQIYMTGSAGGDWDIV